MVVSQAGSLRIICVALCRSESVGNVKWFRGGLVFKAHSLVYHSTLGWRVSKKKKKNRWVVSSGRHLYSEHCRRVSSLWRYRGTSLIRNRDFEKGCHLYSEHCRRVSSLWHSSSVWPVSEKYAGLPSRQPKRQSNPPSCKGYLAHKKQPPAWTLQ